MTCRGSAPVKLLLWQVKHSVSRYPSGWDLGARLFKAASRNLDLSGLKSNTATRHINSNGEFLMHQTAPISHTNRADDNSIPAAIPSENPGSEIGAWHRPALQRLSVSMDTALTGGSGADGGTRTGP